VDIEGDRQLLAAALANIVQNACKFTPTEGRVSVKTSAGRDRVVIEVADQCGGLPPGKAEELSLPVQRAEGDAVGLGLGLSISRRSIAASGGHIRVRDVPGIGCIFTIDLPRLAPVS
jgi:signal transduction histidine kinase